MAGLLSDPDIAVASLGVLMSINAFVYMVRLIRLALIA